ncbi:MAG: Uncharacterised protein [Gammaproteobacteria bacterium]|nr:MAG: Uncharacterised protein [Gammaproteobacteria bacterium]
MELGILDEMEGVGQAIVADVKFLSKPWSDLWRCPFVFEQSIIHGLLHRADRCIVFNAGIHGWHCLSLCRNEDLLTVSAFECFR